MQINTKHVGIKFFTLTLLLGLVGGSFPAFAAKIEFNNKKTVIQEIEVKGDLRLRQENFDNNFGTKDRQRQRIRYRQELNIKLPNNVKVKSRLASGGSDPVSTNQTLTDNGSTKGINLDRAYLEWKKKNLANLKVQAGKVKNPFFKTKTKNLVWDSDYNPEGLTQSFSGLLGAVGLFANFGQFVLAEVSGSTKDVYLFVEEVGAEVKLPAQSRLKVAVAHHEFANIRNNSPANALSGNTAGSPFSLYQVQAKASTWLFGVPVALHVNKLRNLAAKKTTLGGALSTAEEQDKAIAAGISVGKAKKPKQVEGSLIYKEIENDAHVQGIGDSDFHDGSLNAKGWVASIAVAITNFMKAQITHFDTEDKVVATGATDGSFTRTQFDLITKFK